MGAYGMNACEYCGKLYHDLDMHECDPGDMKTFIDALRARLAASESMVKSLEQDAYIVAHVIIAEDIKKLQARLAAMTALVRAVDDAHTQLALVGFPQINGKYHKDGEWDFTKTDTQNNPADRKAIATAFAILDAALKAAAEDSSNAR